MLFLDDSDELNSALFAELARRIVPDRHVLSAARSPRSEYQQQYPFTPKVGD